MRGKNNFADFGEKRDLRYKIIEALDTNLRQYLLSKTRDWCGKKVEVKYVKTGESKKTTGTLEIINICPPVVWVRSGIKETRVELLSITSIELLDENKVNPDPELRYVPVERTKEFMMQL